jgi:hypothetical protein
LLLLLTLLVPLPADPADGGAVNDVLTVRDCVASDSFPALVGFVLVLSHFFANGSKRSRPADFFDLGVLGAIIFIVGFVLFSPFVVRPIRGHLAPFPVPPAIRTSLVAVKERLRGKTAPWDKTSAVAASDCRISHPGDHKGHPNVDDRTGEDQELYQ